MFDKVEWIKENLESPRLSKSPEWTAVCPFCDRFGGFYVNCKEEGKGPFVCFKCGERSQSMPRLLAHVEGITVKEAYAFFMRESFEFRRRETSESLLDRIKSIRSFEGCEDMCIFAEEIGTGLPEEFISIWDGKKYRVPLYLTDRGFKNKTLKEWGVGYCQTGRFSHRAIIPAVCPAGRSFTARDMTGEQQPKYLNPTGVDHSRLLFGWDRCPLGSDFTIVEGPLDAMKMCQHGLPSMAIGGKVLHTKQLSMLFNRSSSAAATVMLDPEAMKESFDVASQLLVHFDSVYVSQLSEGIDPGDSTKKQAYLAYGKSIKFFGDRKYKVLEAIKRSCNKIKSKFL